MKNTQPNNITINIKNVERLDASEITKLVDTGVQEDKLDIIINKLTHIETLLQNITGDSKSLDLGLDEIKEEIIEIVKPETPDLSVPEIPIETIIEEPISHEVETNSQDDETPTVDQLDGTEEERANALASNFLNMME